MSTLPMVWYSFAFHADYAHDKAAAPPLLAAFWGRCDLTKHLHCLTIIPPWSYDIKCFSDPALWEKQSQINKPGTATAHCSPVNVYAILRGAPLQLDCVPRWCMFFLDWRHRKRFLCKVQGMSRLNRPGICPDAQCASIQADVTYPVILSCFWLSSYWHLVRLPSINCNAFFHDGQGHQGSKPKFMLTNRLWMQTNRP